MLCQTGRDDESFEYAFVGLDGSVHDPLPLPAAHDLRPIAFLHDQELPPVQDVLHAQAQPRGFPLLPRTYRIVEQLPVPFFQAAEVHFQGGLPVFQIICHGARFGRKLAGLAHQDQGFVQVQPQGRPEQEPARFDAGEGIEIDPGQLPSGDQPGEKSSAS